MATKPKKTSAAVADSSGKLPKKVNIALQGSGAHGVFSWGVLDKFLEDGGIEISEVNCLIWLTKMTDSNFVYAISV